MVKSGSARAAQGHPATAPSQAPCAPCGNADSGSTQPSSNATPEAAPPRPPPHRLPSVDPQSKGPAGAAQPRSPAQSAPASPAPGRRGSGVLPAPFQAPAQLPAPEPLLQEPQPCAAAAAQPPQPRAAAEEASQDDIEAALCCLLLGTIQVRPWHFSLCCGRVRSGIHARQTATGPVAPVRPALVLRTPVEQTATGWCCVPRGIVFSVWSLLEALL